jgi:hypothetical protein
MGASLLREPASLQVQEINSSRKLTPNTEAMEVSEEGSGEEDPAEGIKALWAVESEAAEFIYYFH